MTKNKLIFAASLIATLFILSSLLEGDKTEPAPDLSSMTRQSPDVDCPSMSNFMMHNPEATPEEMYEVEECNRELARQSGRDQANTGFLGNTRTRPEGALAHYELDYGRSNFTVYEDRIETVESPGSDKKTVIPFSRVTDIKEDWQMPSAVLIEYKSARGTPFAYTFMMLSDDDMIKAEGARDIDRLISLLQQQKRLAN